MTNNCGGAAPIIGLEPAPHRGIALALETAVDVATSDDAAPAVSFATEPTRYAHWHLSLDGAVATLTMDVEEWGGCVRATR